MLCLPDFARQNVATNQYTFKELKNATQKFHTANKLGEGGFGEVYLVKLKIITNVICVANKIYTLPNLEMTSFIAAFLMGSKVYRLWLEGGILLYGVHWSSRKVLNTEY